MEVTVKHLTGKMFAAHCGNRHILIDQPEEKGGFGSGLSPIDHFIISLTSCVATYVAGYCQSHEVDLTDMQVKADWEMENKPTRIRSIDVTVTLPHADLGKRESAVMKTAEKCAIKRALSDPPKITLAVEGGNEE